MNSTIISETVDRLLRLGLGIEGVLDYCGNLAGTPGTEYFEAHYREARHRRQFLAPGH